VPTPAPPPPPPEVEQPISVSAAVAILDLSERPARSFTPPSRVPESSEQGPTPRAPGAPVGVIRSGRLGRRKVDLVAYDGNLVIAKRGAPDNLTSGQLAAQDANSRILVANTVEEAIVREDAVSGQVRIKMHLGDDVVVRWPGWKNRGVSAENLLAHAFPGKVDQGSPEIAKRTVRVMMTLGVTILVAVVAFLGLSTLLKSDPPPRRRCRHRNRPPAPPCSRRARRGSSSPAPCPSATVRTRQRCSPSSMRCAHGSWPPPMPAPTRST
jgi:hypothetical protein